MKLYRLHRVQRLPITIEDAWRFFVSPHNLSTITPPWLDLQVTNNPPDPVYAGAIITYSVKPLLGLSVDWVTEITHVNKPYLFVDEQRIGPYRMWHHEHHFVEVDFGDERGIEMTDIVTYAMPFGRAGRLAHRLLVGERLEGIFDFRRDVLRARFGLSEPAGLADG